MMKFVLSFILLVILFAVGVYTWRNINRQVTTVTQKDKTIESTNLGPALRQGTFEAIDPVHKGTGRASVYQLDGKPILKFEGDFSVTRGPDLFVYLSKNPAVESVLNPDLGSYVSLGKLQSTTGSQIYTLPADAADYHTVLVWCRAFSVLFTKATLSSI